MGDAKGKGHAAEPGEQDDGAERDGEQERAVIVGSSPIHGTLRNSN